MNSKLKKIIIASSVTAIITAITVFTATSASAAEKRDYTINDATRIQRIVAEYEKETPDAISLYDYNKNGRLDISDATYLQRMLAEFKTTAKTTFLTLNTTEAVIGKNETLTLTYNTDAKSVEFSSANPHVAVVNNKGKVTPKGIGSTTILCTAPDGVKAECKIQVLEEAKSVTLNCTSIKLGLGESFTLSSTVPDGTAAYERTYTSSDKNIASIEPQGGLVTTKSVGKANITCTLKNGTQAVCEVNVMPPAKTVTLNATVLTLGIGETFDVDSYAPAGTASAFRYYYSDDTYVAEVKKSGGIITAAAEGKTTIRCKTNTGATATLNLTVTKTPQKVTLNTYDSKEKVGKSYNLYAYTDTGSDKNRVFEYSSSDPSVVIIANYKYNSSTLTPKSQGTAYITVKTYNGISAVCKVTVSGTTVQCVDISTWQTGGIDFNKVKAAEINHVIMRAGYGTKIDNQFENNYAKAKAAGMKIGVYWFSYATTDAGGIAEANACLKVLNGRSLDMPVYFDVEYLSSYAAHKQMVYNFCDTIKKSGYKTGVYASASDYTTYFSPTDFYSREYSVWNAHWAKNTPVVCDIWQYSEKGYISGIPTVVDMNYIYNLNICE